MVKYSSYRTAKYAKKLRADVPKEIEEGQRKHYKISANELVKIEQVVKRIVSGSFIPYYIIFGKECVKRAGIHKSENLKDEIRMLQDKWISRGLDGELLDRIKVALNIPIPLPILENWFTLDVSILDGPDVLP